MSLGDSEVQRRGACPSHTFRIWIAGPVREIERVCAEFCTERGFCVAVEQVRYVYTGGREDGAVVTVLNYPRFPKSLVGLETVAEELATRLIEQVHQGSATVEGSDQSVFLSRRPTDG